MIKLTGKEMCNLLNVTSVNLRKIKERNQLEERLMSLGYILLGCHKEGRSYVYELKNTDIPLNISIKELCKKLQIRDYDLFLRLIDYLTNNPYDIKPANELPDILNGKEHTIQKYITTLIDNEIFRQDGFYYVKYTHNINGDVAEVTLVDEVEYNAHETQAYTLKEIANIVKQSYMEGKASKIARDYAYTEYIAFRKHSIITRRRKIVPNIENPIYVKLIQLMKGVR